MADGPTRAAWQAPPGNQDTLQRYVETLRERIWLILAVVLLTTAAAALYVVTADRVYQAEADLLVTPVPGDDPAFAGLGVIRESSDPTRDIATAARFVTAVPVALRVRAMLGLRESPRQTLARVTAEPVAQSNVVAITGKGPTPRAAQDLVNAFASAAVADRTRQFHAQLDTAITQIQARVGGGRSAQTNLGPDSLAGQLARLQVIRGSPDPTLRVAAPADPPTSPVSPQPLYSLAGGLFGGLVLGVGGAFALQLLDPRLRRESQLRQQYRLPILARIPKVPRRVRSGPVPPESLPPAMLEAYRTLRATIVASRRGGTGPRAILVTSSSPGEGKTTTAVNLASSLALAGHRVILLEADLRRPTVGRALGVTARSGTGSVLVGSVSLESALVSVRAYGDYLRLLLAEEANEASGWMADRLFLPTARELVDDAKALADYVVIDSPPLTTIIDALPLALRADDVLLVARLDGTHLPRLRQLSELLAHHDITPVGFALLGASEARGDSYYTYGRPSRRSRRGIAGRWRARRDEAAGDQPAASPPPERASDPAA
jgi:Mrp family chromosome partitioning ATPase